MAEERISLTPLARQGSIPARRLEGYAFRTWNPGIRQQAVWNPLSVSGTSCPIHPAESGAGTLRLPLYNNSEARNWTRRPFHRKYSAINAY